MNKIQQKRCGATRTLRYCLTLVGASIQAALILSALACSPEGSAPLETLESVAHAEEAAPEPAKTPMAERPAVVFLGTSLTAGYGLREDQAFPALVEARMQTEGFDYRVVNAGVSGDTSAGGLRRLDWLLRLPISVLVVELGANDMLRGLSVEALEKNLDAIVERTRASHPDARFLIAGMRAAPNLGSEYREAFDRIYPALAERHSARLVPFILEDVAARRSLNQADGIHPTAEGHALIADRLWAALEPMLRNAERLGRRAPGRNQPQDPT